MTKIIAFAEIDGSPATTFVAGGADIRFGEDAIDGRIFLARRGRAIAVCAELDRAGGWSQSGLRQLAGRQELRAQADIEQRNGLDVVTRLWLSNSPYTGSSGGWVQGRDIEQLNPLARWWYAPVAVAAMAPSSRLKLPVPTLDRPDGSGNPVVIDLLGEIGEGRNTADRIVPQIMSAPLSQSSIALNINSVGGHCDDGLAIYRALAEHPFAVRAQIIRKAHSMAAVVALAADHRVIGPDGTMMFHTSAIWSVPGRTVAADLRRMAADCERIDCEIAGIIAAHCAFDVEDIREMMAAETYLSAGAAIKSGLVDAIATDQAPAKPRPVRAKFAPISGPYRPVRAAGVPTR